MADFTGKTYQILKEQILIAKFYKFFQKIEQEIILSNSFLWGQYYPDTKTRKGYHTQKRRYSPISLMYIE